MGMTREMVVLFSMGLIRRSIAQTRGGWGLVLCMLIGGGTGGGE